MKVLLLGLALLVAGNAPADTFRFALIGDTPYTASERRLLPGMLDAIAESSAAFVIHIGDLKNGRSPCSDALLADRRKLFDEAPLPIVYLPGDNDWTDCHRTSNGSYDPLERLDHLRREFFAAPRTLGRRTLVVERQSAALPEHVRWRFGPALFIGLNVPGGDNNWGTKATPSAEYRQRLPLVLDWLRQGFALARREAVRVLVIGMQANPDFKLFAVGTPNGSYRELLETLRAETSSFAGEVILVHGDTHSQRIDQPLLDPDTGARLRNFTRIETYGSPFMGWIMVVIDDARSPLLRFETRPYAAENRNVIP